MVRQKVPKSYFQSQFSMSKIYRIFSKKNYLRLSIFETVEKNEHLISAIWSSAKNHGPKCIKRLISFSLLERLSLILTLNSLIIWFSKDKYRLAPPRAKTNDVTMPMIGQSDREVARISSFYGLIVTLQQ